MSNKKFSPVHCRVCKEVIDRNVEKENIDWVMPSKNWFFHKKCYESWRAGRPNEDEEWIDYIYDFIARDLKAEYDFWKCEGQRKKFLKDNMTNKGIFFALKYFYEVKHGNWEKGYEGIGIVPYIYKESCEYWAQKERINEGLLKQIEEQMKQAEVRSTKVIRKKKKNKKVTIDFDAIEKMGDS